jgi:D-alanine-D-alanine ligase
VTAPPDRRADRAALPPVVVLFGGPSAEHDVSVVSGSAIAAALEDRGVDVRLVLIDLDGRWWWLPPGHRRGDLEAASYDDPAAFDAEGPVSVGAAIDRLAAASPPPVVFVALHGTFGEDGVVQGLLEAAGVAYTGAGVAASAIGMDKALFKRLVRGIGLPVVDWREVTATSWERDRAGVLAELAAFTSSLGDERLMVKPARLGSSLGMTIAHDASEWPAALDEAFRYDTLALAERYLVRPREIEVSVIGNDPARIEQYGPGEVISGREFYDYVAKYTPGLSETMTNAELEPRQRALILKYARDAYRAAGVEGFARIDFLLSGSEIFLSEINTIPGFTPISLFPSMPASSGLDFGRVCVRVVELAIERHARRVQRHLRASDLPR